MAGQKSFACHRCVALESVRQSLKTYDLLPIYEYLMPSIL